MTLSEDLAANPPSSIRLGIPPLYRVFEVREVEMAAALLVIACRHHGDRWQPIGWDQFEEAMQSVVDSRRQPDFAILRGRLPQPEFDRLVELRHAAWHGAPGQGLLELAPNAIVAIARRYGRGS